MAAGKAARESAGKMTPPGPSSPDDGSHCRSTAKSRISIVPSQNAGTACPRRAVILATMSHNDPGRAAAITPRNDPTATARVVATTVSQSVAGNRSSTAPSAGRPLAPGVTKVATHGAAHEIEILLRQRPVESVGGPDLALNLRRRTGRNQTRQRIAGHMQQSERHADHAEEHGYGMQQAIDEKADHQGRPKVENPTSTRGPPDAKTPGGRIPRAKLTFW